MTLPLLRKQVERAAFPFTLILHPSVTGHWSPVTGHLIELHARRLYHPAPPPGFLFHERGHLRRRTADRLCRKIGQSPCDIRELDRLRDRRRQPGRDLLRGAGWRHHAKPRYRHEPG